MKRIVFAIALFLSFGLGYANNNVRTIKAPRFARPLVEKWIEEYAKTEPGVEFQIVKGSGNQENIDLNVEFDNQDKKDTKAFSHIVYLGHVILIIIRIMIPMTT